MSSSPSVSKIYYLYNSKINGFAERGSDCKKLIPFVVKDLNIGYDIDPKITLEFVDASLVDNNSSPTGEYKDMIEASIVERILIVSALNSTDLINFINIMYVHTEGQGKIKIVASNSSMDDATLNKKLVMRLTPLDIVSSKTIALYLKCVNGGGTIDDCKEDLDKEIIMFYDSESFWSQSVLQLISTHFDAMGQKYLFYSFNLGQDIRNVFGQITTLKDKTCLVLGEIGGYDYIGKWLNYRLGFDPQYPNPPGGFEAPLYLYSGNGSVSDSFYFPKVVELISSRNLPYDPNVPGAPPCIFIPSPTTTRVNYNKYIYDKIKVPYISCTLFVVISALQVALYIARNNPIDTWDDLGPIGLNILNDIDVDEGQDAITFQLAVYQLQTTANSDPLSQSICPFNTTNHITINPINGIMKSSSKLPNNLKICSETDYCYRFRNTLPLSMITKTITTDHVEPVTDYKLNNVNMISDTKIVGTNANSKLFANNIQPGSIKSEGISIMQKFDAMDSVYNSYSTYC